MAKSTIHDINQLVERKGMLKKTSSTITKEEYLAKSPSKIASVEKLPTFQLDTVQEKSSAVEQIAKYIDNLAKEEGKSFAEIWLEVLEEGAKIDSVIKGGGVVSLLKNIQKTSFSLFKDQLDELNPFRRKRK